VVGHQLGMDHDKALLKPGSLSISAW